MILKINDRIRNRKVEFFDEFSLNLRYDSVASAFAFSAYFNPDNIEHKEMYCVGHDHICTLEHNGELLLTGYLLNQGFNRNQVRNMTKLSGYSFPGVLEDCQIAPDNYPLQSDGLSLRQIASKYIQPFGIKMVVDPSVASGMDKIYDDSITAEITDTVKDFLTKLAAQRDIIITHDEKGRLVFTKAKTNQKPILDFNIPNGTAIPGTSISFDFNGQAMHSHIYVVKEASDEEGGNAGQSMVRNPYVPFVYRPKVLTQTSGDDNDTELAAKRALAAELKNMRLTIVTDRWEVDNKIIKPNNLITVTCPDAYLYKKSLWFVESIGFIGNKTSTTATLTCCVPEVYNGQTPKYLFAGINLH